MTTVYCELSGEGVPPREFQIDRARDLALRLEADQIPFADLVSCYRHEQTEVVVFDVDIEVPQIRRHPIQSLERVAAVFVDDDSVRPTVYALRKDFPQVPHLNLDVEEFPRNLCLDDQRWEESRLRWTPARFVHGVRDWFSLTARGVLHQQDQPLEPILLEFSEHLVLPRQLLERDSKHEQLWVVGVPREEGSVPFLKALVAPPEKPNLKILASVHYCQPRTHGIIHHRPVTLTELADLVRPAGLDLIDELRTCLKNWYLDGQAILDSRLLLVILFPKTRVDGGEIEAVDPWAFYLGDNVREENRRVDVRIRELGTRIGIWGPQDDAVGLFMEPDVSLRGDDVGVEVLNVTFGFNRGTASILNDVEPGEERIAAVGVGALGSQVALNLLRGGFGRWSFIDHDDLMPHNLARHALHGLCVGWKKAHAMAVVANDLFSDQGVASSLTVDVLAPDERSAELESTLQESDLILDMSTSVAVSRRLCCDIDSKARRISTFLSPTGHDLVVLAEDRERDLRLDAIEMQYYRAVASTDALVGHLEPPQQGSRYGHSCRDITSRLPQHLVGLHAAIASQAIREAGASAGPTLAIWRTDERGNVQRIDIELQTAVHHAMLGWTVVFDDGLRFKLSGFRDAKLPNETGGVLLGSFDLERKIVYIADALPSPPDSEEWPTLYIRGRKGLRRAVEDIEQRTHGMLEYVGEWHSHPRGVATAASGHDQEVFSWLTELMEVDGLPAVMLIVGDPGNISCYLGQIFNAENLLPVTGP